MKIAACVILYHPDAAVESNIISYINNIEKIFVIDNSEINQSDLKFLSTYSTKSIHINDGNNQGIAERLNQACALAIDEGFDFLLTMDQDSYFKSESLRNYFNCIASYEDKSKVAMFGINYQEQSLNNCCTHKTVNHLITSGSTINLNIYKKIGIFNEDLYIDFVDTDFCFRSVLKGFKLIEFPNIFMHHEIGVTTQQRSFKNLKLTKRSIHSSIRLYYMVRNFLYLNKIYKTHFETELSGYKKDLQNRIKNKLLYNKNRLQTFETIIKAWKDFSTNKMGKRH